MRGEGRKRHHLILVTSSSFFSRFSHRIPHRKKCSEKKNVKVGPICSPIFPSSPDHRFRTAFPLALFMMAVARRSSYDFAKYISS